MFGRKAKRIAELEEHVKSLKSQLETEYIVRINAEAMLYRARNGEDVETNAFFRAHPVYVEPEPLADAGTRTVVAKKASKKAK